jgi:hypothetical protein
MTNLKFALKNRATGNYFAMPKVIFINNSHNVSENDEAEHTKCWVTNATECSQFGSAELAQSFLDNKSAEFERFNEHFDIACIPYGCSTQPEFDLMNSDIVNI